VDVFDGFTASKNKIENDSQRKKQKNRTKQKFKRHFVRLPSVLFSSLFPLSISHLSVIFIQNQDRNRWAAIKINASISKNILYSDR
jgi:hypothetical protein